MNRAEFYKVARGTLGPLTQANVEGFELVLNEGELRRSRRDDLAYILATAWWESGKTMQPVREAYWKDEAWRKKNFRYYPFYGRGLVQLTWEANYRKASELYGVDLVKRPDLAMEPGLSVKILFDGTLGGWFTGKDLGDYIDGVQETEAEDLREWTNARRVVNGTDKALEIAKLAAMFRRALVAGGFDMAPAPQTPVDAPASVPAPIPPANPEPAPMPEKIGPVLVPVEPRPANPPTITETASKAFGAAKWTAFGMGIWTLIVQAEVLRPPFDSAEFNTVAQGLIAIVVSGIGAYVAKANRTQ